MAIANIAIEAEAAAQPGEYTEFRITLPCTAASSKAGAGT
jgi:hypothetical protein